MLITILTAILLLLYAILILFYYFHWKRVPVFTLDNLSADRPKVSVVIAARNEEDNLPLLLEDLKNQTYPVELYEVIVVNDFSTDGTASIIEKFSNNFRMLLPACSPEQSGKKKAIATGVQHASGELIAVTDADCRLEPHWLSYLAHFYFSTSASFIAAPVQYQHNHSLLEILQALDFMTLQGITAASVSSGYANMANGANLAYAKNAFITVNGFDGIDNVATGDDMLLMEKIWKLDAMKVRYLKSKEAIVKTAPMHNWKDFLMQRRRWASKTFVYDDFKITATLALVYLVNLLFFLLIIAAVINSHFWTLLLIYLIIKTLIELPFISSVASFYNEQNLIKYFFPLQPIHITYTVLVGLLSQFGKYEWKGRRVR